MHDLQIPRTPQEKRLRKEFQALIDAIGKTVEITSTIYKGCSTKTKRRSTIHKGALSEIHPCRCLVILHSNCRESVPFAGRFIMITRVTKGESVLYKNTLLKYEVAEGKVKDKLFGKMYNYRYNDLER